MKSIGMVIVTCMVTSLMAMDNEQVMYNAIYNTIQAYDEQVIEAYVLRTTIAKSLDTDEYFARSVTYEKHDEQRTVLT